MAGGAKVNNRWLHLIAEISIRCYGFSATISAILLQISTDQSSVILWCAGKKPMRAFPAYSTESFRQSCLARLNLSVM